MWFKLCVLLVFNLVDTKLRTFEMSYINGKTLKKPGPYLIRYPWRIKAPKAIRLRTLSNFLENNALAITTLWKEPTTEKSVALGHVFNMPQSPSIGDYIVYLNQKESRINSNYLGSTQKDRHNYVTTNKSSIKGSHPTIHKASNNATDLKDFYKKYNVHDSRLAVKKIFERIFRGKRWAFNVIHENMDDMPVNDNVKYKERNQNESKKDQLVISNIKPKPGDNKLKYIKNYVKSPVKLSVKTLERIGMNMAKNKSTSKVADKILKKSQKSSIKNDTKFNKHRKPLKKSGRYLGVHSKFKKGYSGLKDSKKNIKQKESAIQLNNENNNIMTENVDQSDVKESVNNLSKKNTDDFVTENQQNIIESVNHLSKKNIDNFVTENQHNIIENVNHLSKKNIDNFVTENQHNIIGSVNHLSKKNVDDFVTENEYSDTSDMLKEGENRLEESNQYLNNTDGLLYDSTPIYDGSDKDLKNNPKMDDMTSNILKHIFSRENIVRLLEKLQFMNKNITKFQAVSRVTNATASLDKLESSINKHNLEKDISTVKVVEPKLQLNRKDAMIFIIRNLTAKNESLNTEYLNKVVNKNENKKKYKISKQNMIFVSEKSKKYIVPHFTDGFRGIKQLNTNNSKQIDAHKFHIKKPSLPLYLLSNSLQQEVIKTNQTSRMPNDWSSKRNLFWNRYRKPNKLHIFVKVSKRNNTKRVNMYKDRDNMPLKDIRDEDAGQEKNVNQEKRNETFAIQPHLQKKQRYEACKSLRAKFPFILFSGDKNCDEIKFETQDNKSKTLEINKRSLDIFRVSGDHRYVSEKELERTNSKLLNNNQTFLNTVFHKKNEYLSLFDDRELSKYRQDHHINPRMSNREHRPLIFMVNDFKSKFNNNSIKNFNMSPQRYKSNARKQELNGFKWKKNNEIYNMSNHFKKQKLNGIKRKKSKEIYHMSNNYFRKARLAQYKTFYMNETDTITLNSTLNKTDIKLKVNPISYDAKIKLYPNNKLGQVDLYSSRVAEIKGLAPNASIILENEKAPSSNNTTKLIRKASITRNIKKRDLRTFSIFDEPYIVGNEDNSREDIFNDVGANLGDYEQLESKLEWDSEKHFNDKLEIPKHTINRKCNLGMPCENSIMQTTMPKNVFMRVKKKYNNEHADKSINEKHAHKSNIENKTVTGINQFNGYESIGTARKLHADLDPLKSRESAIIQYERERDVRNMHRLVDDYNDEILHDNVFETNRIGIDYSYFNYLGNELYFPAYDLNKYDKYTDFSTERPKAMEILHDQNGKWKDVRRNKYKSTYTKKPQNGHKIDIMNYTTESNFSNSRKSIDYMDMDLTNRDQNNKLGDSRFHKPPTTTSLPKPADVIKNYYDKKRNKLILQRNDRKKRVDVFMHESSTEFVVEQEASFKNMKVYIYKKLLKRNENNLQNSRHILGMWSKNHRTPTDNSILDGVAPLDFWTHKAFHDAKPTTTEFLDMPDQEEFDRRKRSANIPQPNLVCCLVQRSDQHDLAKHVKATWGSRCDVIVLITRKDDEKQSLWEFTMASLGFVDGLNKQHKENSWVLKADIDSYIVIENVKDMVQDYNTELPLYFGQLDLTDFSNFVVSNGALRALRTRRQESECQRNINEDIGLCLQKLGIKVADSRDELGRPRFYSSSPFDFDPETESTPEEALNTWSSHAIAFAHVDKKDMYTLDYFIYMVHPMTSTERLMSIMDVKQTVDQDKVVVAKPSHSHHKFIENDFARLRYLRTNFSDDNSEVVEEVKRLKGVF